MDKMHEYIEALRNGKGYDWIGNHGYDLNKDDLIRIIKEFDYAIHSMKLYDDKDDLYDAVCEELTEWYSEEDWKYFKKFKPKELFTEYIYSLMQNGKDFMFFPNNNQILIDDEVDEWNKVNGITNLTERVLYHKFGDDGYVINYTDAITNVTVPAGMLDWNYEEFIKQCEEDVVYRID